MGQFHSAQGQDAAALWSWQEGSLLSCLSGWRHGPSHSSPLPRRTAPKPAARPGLASWEAWLAVRGRFWNWVQSPCGLSSLAVGTPDTWSCAWPHLRGSDWSCRARACDCGYPCARRRAVSALLPPLPSCAPPPPPTQGRCSQLGAAQPASFGAPVGRRTGLGPPNILNHTSCHYETLSLITDLSWVFV